MKKNIIIILALLSLGAVEANAQSLLDAVKKVTSSSSSSSSSTSKALGGIGELVSGLLGQKKVTAKNLAGTWTYKQPAVVFESEDILTSVAAKATKTTLEKKLQTYLDKIGFTADKIKMTFNEDSTGTITYNSKNIPMRWSVSETELTINLGSGKVSKLMRTSDKQSGFTMNCKITSGTLQLSFKADKLAQFLTKVVSFAGKSSGNSSLASVTSLVNKVDGMYLGLILEKE